MPSSRPRIRLRLDYAPPFSAFTFFFFLLPYQNSVLRICRYRRRGRLRLPAYASPASSPPLSPFPRFLTHQSSYSIRSFLPSLTLPSPSPTRNLSPSPPLRFPPRPYVLPFVFNTHTPRTLPPHLLSSRAHLCSLFPFLPFSSSILSCAPLSSLTLAQLRPIDLTTQQNERPQAREGRRDAGKVLSLFPGQFVALGFLRLSSLPFLFEAWMDGRSAEEWLRTRLAFGPRTAVGDRVGGLLDLCACLQAFGGCRARGCMQTNATAIHGGRLLCLRLHRRLEVLICPCWLRRQVEGGSRRLGMGEPLLVIWIFFEDSIRFDLFSSRVAGYFLDLPDDSPIRYSSNFRTNFSTILGRITPRLNRRRRHPLHLHI
ncbi:hypothetical protein R3P38DRAFT_3520909 [Favolaschia claudopus]|uniref:Uncharacterized protein n=1 Tax=Favolaschia claudopus TaxID=2862362 RepID=A0AAW0BND5_9AGAR